MNNLRKSNPRVLQILKIAGFSFLAIIVLAVLIGLFGLYGSRFNSGGVAGGMPSIAPSSEWAGGTIARDNAVGEYEVMGESLLRSEGVSVDAEEFEITDYQAQIRARNLEESCSSVSGLKSLGYVIFESSSESSKSCHYSFKVERAHTPDVLAIIEDLNPDNISQNTRTIKSQLDDFVSEREILEEKIQAIEETLASATSAYDEITLVASRSADASSLARVVTSRIEVIERLSNERIKLAGQLERIIRAESEALERLDYSQFDIYIYESKYFDGKGMADSWRDSLRKFFDKANEALQGLTIGFATVILTILPIALYVLVLIFALKYIVRFTKYIWKR